MMINDRRQGMIKTTIKFIIMIIVVIAHLFCRENTNPAYFQANEIFQNLINTCSALPHVIISNDANKDKKNITFGISLAVCAFKGASSPNRAFHSVVGGWAGRLSLWFGFKMLNGKRGSDRQTDRNQAYGMIGRQAKL